MPRIERAVEGDPDHDTAYSDWYAATMACATLRGREDLHTIDPNRWADMFDDDVSPCEAVDLGGPR